MFWRSKPAKYERVNNIVASSVIGTPSKADLLKKAPDSLVRMQMCAAWQDRARADWYRGERDEILRVLASRDFRYRDMNAEARKATGKLIWSQSPRNKDLAGAEQMYARWVLTYAAQARAEGLIP